MKIIFVAHADFAIPKYIETWAKEKHFELGYCSPFKGEALPQISEFDWLILLGGTQCLLELDRSPFLIEEICFVKKALAAEKTILGFCLGAQILGEAYGAKTEQSPHKEIGVFSINLTHEGINDPLLKGLPATFCTVHWHEHMPGVPKTATILATSEGCPRQIIRYSPVAYGFQCHLELTFEDIHKANFDSGKDLYLDQYVQSKDDFLKNDFSMINNIMLSVLDNLLVI